MPMPAFSLYVTEARQAQLKAESERLGISQSKVVWMALDAHFAKTRPALAILGKDGVSWTDPMPVEDAKRSLALALPQHPGLTMYTLPHGGQAARGLAIPPEATAVASE